MDTVDDFPEIVTEEIVGGHSMVLTPNTIDPLTKQPEKVSYAASRAVTAAQMEKSIACDMFREWAGTRFRLASHATVR